MARIALLIVLLFGLAGPALSSGAKIVVLGDSLTAGYGLAPGAAFPVRLGSALSKRGHDVEIINAGVSGDTSSGGLARMNWAIGNNTAGVILELGANDALRGLDPARTRSALSDIIAKLKARGIKVLLTGMYAPPNMGQDFTEQFDRIYPDLAVRHDVLLYPFFLDGVAGIGRLNQPDGIHPTPEGVDVIVRRILPSVERLIDQIAKTPD